MRDKEAWNQQLRPFLQPSGIAVIGASSHPNKLGYGVLRNLLHPEWGFPGPVYPVNPRVKEILGRRVYADISMVPDPVDLAVILIPALAVPQAVEACGRRGLKGVIVVSGGFRELGEEGEQLQQDVVRVARDYHIRLMGPNGIGIIDTIIPLNTTFVRNSPLQGQIAMISQSGALCGAAIDWTRARGIGFSRMYSVGNQADLVETDFLELLSGDPHTDVICLYIEEISDGRRFYERASEVVKVKPILLLKAGRTKAGQEAARSHTGAMAGEAVAYKTACEDAGVHWCSSLQEMLEAAQALVATSPMRGRRVAIITNAGGPASLAADALAEYGLALAHPNQRTQQQLRAVLPPAAQVTSIVDMLGAAGSTEYQGALEAVSADPGVDGVLAIHVPQATVEPVDLISAVKKTRGQSPIPLVFAFPGQETVGPALAAANKIGIPSFTFPEDGVRVLMHLEERARILEHPASVPERPTFLPDPQQFSFPQKAILTDWDLRPVLAAYGIPVPAGGVARTPEQAAALASSMGFPVAVKVISPHVLHKSEMGAVELDVTSPEEVKRVADRLLAQHPKITFLEVQKMIPHGIEVILGITRDPQFGPLVMLGSGGILVELLHDVAFSLTPLDKTRAQRLLKKTSVWKLLQGVRGKPPSDVEALVDILIRLSWLATDWPTLAEMDINPLIVLDTGHGAVAVDARARTIPAHELELKGSAPDLQSG